MSSRWLTGSQGHFVDSLSCYLLYFSILFHQVHRERTSIVFHIDIMPQYFLETKNLGKYKVVFAYL